MKQKWVHFFILCLISMVKLINIEVILKFEMISDLFSISDNVIIITGSGRGIGAHLAFSMAKHSAYVYCISTSFPKGVTKKMSEHLFQINCDVSDHKKFQEICAKIFTKHKKIDVLINNAGVTFPKNHTVIYPEKKWLDTIKINLTAAFNCSQVVIKYMIKNRHGSIINITSINADLGFPNNPAYVASKGGLKMLGKALARDYGKYGIRVNNLGPGYIKTDMNKKSYMNMKIRKAREKQIILGRWGNAEDLVGPCIFLISDASRYITGQDIYVDGGWTANGLSI